MNLEQRKVVRWSLLLLGAVILIWYYDNLNHYKEMLMFSMHPQEPPSPWWLLSLVLSASSQFVWAGRTKTGE